MKFLFIIIFDIVFLVFYTIQNVFFKASDALNNFATILDPIVNLFNLIFVIGFYINDQKERKKSEKMEYKFFWYKEIVLPRINKTIDEFISKAKGLYRDYKIAKELDRHKQGSNSSDYENYIQNIITGYTKLNNRTKEEIRYALKIIDEDVSRGLMSEFIKLQDIYTNEILKQDVDFEHLEHLLNLEQNILSNKLYEHGKDKF